MNITANTLINQVSINAPPAFDNSAFRKVGNWFEGSGNSDNYIWGDAIV